MAAAKTEISSRADSGKVLVTITAVFIIILELLDVTIVNVALPDIRGGLAANLSQLAWVINAYIVASAVITPLSGAITKRVGRRTLLLLVVPFFIFFSILCGLSTNMDELILMRACQGLFAGTMIPAAEAVLFDAYSLEERPKAMMFFGMGVMFGPVLGPFLGGLIDQAFHWRAIFFANVPLGIIAIFLIIAAVRETEKVKEPTDYVGLIFMFLMIISIELVLAEGNSYSWFQSNFIIICFGIFILSAGFFIWRGLVSQYPIINLRLFTDCNFSVSAIFIFCFGIPLLGTMVLIPLFLDALYHFPPLLIGNLLLLRGVGSLLMIPPVMMLQKKLNINIDPRIRLFLGLVFGFIGSFLMSRLPINASIANLIWPLLFQGFSVGLIMPTVVGAAFYSIKAQWLDQATGVFNLIRSLGFSFGTVLMTALLDHFQQITFAEVGGHVNVFNHYLEPYLHSRGLTLHSSGTPQVLHDLIQDHSQMIAYNSCFLFVVGVVTAMVILLFFFNLKRKKAASAAMA